MSIDSTSSTIYHKRALKPTLSHPHIYPFSRRSLKTHHEKGSSLNNRPMSVIEDKSDDILTDLSTIPFISNSQVNTKCNRRFSELKLSLIEQSQKKNSDRRNSIPQMDFNPLLRQVSRSNKYQQKSTIKDQLNTSFDTFNNSSSSTYYNGTMTTRTENLPQSRILTSTNSNGSRTNLSISNDTLSSISHEDSTSSLFTFDICNTEPRSTENVVLKLNTSLCVSELYREHFFEYFHINYSGELQQEGLFLASLRYIHTKLDHLNEINRLARVIIRTSTANYDVSEIVNEKNDDNILQVLFEKVHLSTIQTCKPIGDPKANEKLYLFDKSNDERQNCKIGLVYQRSDQTDEYEIFSNDIISEDLLNFLHILAKPVRLKGFDKYRGDLDVKSDLHGEYSYHTQYNNHEIMFNIAPMIPSTNGNGQCVTRKGLVGNSFVCIVFQESDAEFQPDFISGKVTQIYIVVQPFKLNQQIYYKVGIWHRNEIISTIQPSGGIYECDKYFRNYFLTLLLNAIHVAIESPNLKSRVAEQRQRLKQEELKKLSQNLSIGQIFETIPATINNHNSYIERSIPRDDSITSDNSIIIPNTERISPAPSKKRTLSKILSVFTSRSGSLSVPSNGQTNDIVPLTLPSSDVSTVQVRKVTSNSKEPIKRAASVKQRPAPAPPVPARIPLSYARHLSSGQSATLPHTSSHSNVSNFYHSTNESLPLQNHLLNSSAYEESVRDRANSSPGDSINPTTKRPLSNVSNISKDNSDTNSPVDDFDDEEEDDDFSDEEKYEHRPTLTEPLSKLPS